jgi:hypothetical protein
MVGVKKFISAQQVSIQDTEKHQEKDYNSQHYPKLKKTIHWHQIEFLTSMLIEFIFPNVND